MIPKFEKRNIHTLEQPLTQSYIEGIIDRMEKERINVLNELPKKADLQIYYMK